MQNMQIESTNLPNILQYIIIRSSNLINMNDFDILTVVYNLKKIINSKVFSFDTFVTKLVHRFFQENIILPCSYEASEIVDQHDKNILTGN